VRTWRLAVAASFQGGVKRQCASTMPPTIHTWVELPVKTKSRLRNLSAGLQQTA
jgi:hypothetical protein